jgi:2-octaprenyl-6-methoxyphenol hydroxylase
MNQSILVLGCGLSGMLTALKFAINKIPVTILESRSISNINFCDDIRTTALTPLSIEFLKEIDMLQELLPSFGIMKEVYIFDNQAPEILNLKDKNNILGYIAENNIFRIKLLNKILNNPLIHVIDNIQNPIIESFKDKTMIYYDNHKIYADLLIICDSYFANIRGYYFSNKIDKSYEQTSITFLIKHEKEHNYCALEHFMHDGPLALLPLVDLYKSSVIWTVKTDDAIFYKNLLINDLTNIIQDHCGKNYGKIEIISEISFFPLKAKLTNKYFYNRMVLVADSAHIIHPLAGQGLNQGIKDIKYFTDLIISNGISDVILNKYQDARKIDNFHMYLITDYLNLIFSNNSKILWYLRRLGLKSLNKISIIKYLMIQYAMGKRF